MIYPGDAGVRDDIFKWLATGQVGESSKAMAFAMAGIKAKTDHPLDPADFNRCLLLLHKHPGLRDFFPFVRDLSPVWAKLIDRWDEVEKCFVEEVGLNWRNGHSAPKTYKLMKEIGC